jgi:DNA-binding XRE family transcriptional regulator
MKKWKENLDNLVALDYIRFLNVPMESSIHGPIIALPSHLLDQLAAVAVIKERIPLRGKEVKFLRKVIGLSLEKFAGKMGLSSGTVFHWEKSEENRLAPVNEAAVRSFIAEELKIEISSKFSQLIGEGPHYLEIKAS